jgi:hypothetical protein
LSGISRVESLDRSEVQYSVTSGESTERRRPGVEIVARVVTVFHSLLRIATCDRWRCRYTSLTFVAFDRRPRAVHRSSRFPFLGLSSALTAAASVNAGLCQASHLNFVLDCRRQCVADRPRCLFGMFVTFV